MANVDERRSSPNTLGTECGDIFPTMRSQETSAALRDRGAAQSACTFNLANACFTHKTLVGVATETMRADTPPVSSTNFARSPPVSSPIRDRASQRSVFSALVSAIAKSQSADSWKQINTSAHVCNSFLHRTAFRVPLDQMQNGSPVPEPRTIFERHIEASFYRLCRKPCYVRRHDDVLA